MYEDIKQKVRIILARFICVDPSQCCPFISRNNDCFSSSWYGREEGEDIHEGKFTSYFWIDVGGQRALLEFASSLLPSAQNNLTPSSRVGSGIFLFALEVKSTLHALFIIHYGNFTRGHFQPSVWPFFESLYYC